MPRRIAGPDKLADHSTAARSAPEDQAQDKPDSERGKDGLGRVFAHILLGVFLKCADPLGRIAPGLFRLATRFAPGMLRLTAVFSRDCACGGFQILSRFTCMLFAAF